MKLEDQNKTGLLPGHIDVLPRGYKHVRLTLPAREALAAAGAAIHVMGTSACGSPVHSVQLLRKTPPGLVVVRVPGDAGIAIRLAEEPAYPGEQGKMTYWEQLDFTPCPKCGAPLVWYEAAYVPGYRVCAGKKHHHFLAR